MISTAKAVDCVHKCRTCRPFGTVIPYWNHAKLFICKLTNTPSGKFFLDILFNQIVNENRLSPEVHEVVDKIKVAVMALHYETKHGYLECQKELIQVKQRLAVLEKTHH